jgi:hypothetical protein
MGSVGEHTKGATPFLDRIKDHNENYHQMILKCRANAPIHLKLLYIIGIKQPLYNWESRNQFRYWGKSKESDEVCEEIHKGV